jgi:pentapeptide repeat protein
MANEKHLAILRQGVDAWNQWRKENPEIQPDLREANLIEANLSGANLDGAGLYRADFGRAELSGADLSGAYLKEANLIRANLSEAVLFRAKLIGADLSGAYLFGAYLIMADLNKAKLIEANLIRTDLSGANLSEADLRDADLRQTTLVKTNLSDANLTNCCVYGISAWGVKLEKAKQLNLVITPPDEPTITMDNLEVAQFVYLFLNNQKIRDVIDTITTKAVLILGGFTQERKAILEAIREELRKYNYLPILFDFNIPGDRNITETLNLLARMARFIIADLTEPSSVPKELEAIVPTVVVPIQPLLQGSKHQYSPFKDYREYNWILKEHRYQSLSDLLTSIREKVIAPAEAKVKELEKRRNKPI